MLGGFGEKDGKEDLGVGKPDADECFDHTKDRSSTDCSGWCSPDPGVGAPEVEAIVSTQAASVALNTIMKMSLDTEYKTYNFHRIL